MQHASNGTLSHSHGGECNIHLYHTAMVGSATCISITQPWRGVQHPSLSHSHGGECNIHLYHTAMEGSATSISITQPWRGVQHPSLSHSHGGAWECNMHAFIISIQKHITIECNIYQAIQALLSKPQWWKGVDLHSQPQWWMESSRRKVLICSLYRAKSLLCAAR